MIQRLWENTYFIDFILPDPYKSNEKLLKDVLLGETLTQISRLLSDLVM